MRASIRRHDQGPGTLNLSETRPFSQWFVDFEEVMSDGISVKPSGVRVTCAPPVYSGQYVPTGRSAGRKKISPQPYLYGAPRTLRAFKTKRPLAFWLHFSCPGDLRVDTPNAEDHRIHMGPIILAGNQESDFAMMPL